MILNGAAPVIDENFPIPLFSQSDFGQTCFWGRFTRHRSEGRASSREELSSSPLTSRDIRAQFFK